MQVKFPGLQEIDSCSQSAKTVFAKGSPKQAEDTHWFISISSGLGDALRNRLEDSLEPIRLNAAKNLPPEDQVANSPNSLRSLGVVNDSFQNVVTCRKSTSHDFQNASVVQLLEYVASDQDCFPVFFGNSVQSAPQFPAPIPRLTLYSTR